MRRPLVLNTRAQEQAAELSHLLREAGFEPVEAPAIAIVAGWEPAELETVRQALRAGLFDWVVLPSQNAARGLEADLGTVRIVCGAATAEALGIVPEVALERFSAAATLDVLRPRMLPGARVLVPRAAEGRDELRDGLVRLGGNLASPVAYRTVATADAANRLRAGGIDIATACSPSALRSLAPALTPDVSLVCLGSTTAEEARNHGVRVDAVARRTSMESLVEAVRQLPLLQGSPLGKIGIA